MYRSFLDVDYSCIMKWMGKELTCKFPFGGIKHGRGALVFSSKVKFEVLVSPFH